MGAGLENIEDGSARWGDYDGDGDLDVLLTGRDGNSNPFTAVYRNNSTTANTQPNAPSTLTAAISPDGTTLSFDWVAGSDSETAAASLTYNLRLGTTSGGQEVSPAMANTATGYRRVAKLGNTNHNTSWHIDLPREQFSEWSVQSVDAGFAGSAFASPESVFLAPVVTSIGDVPDDQGGYVRVQFNQSELDSAIQTGHPIQTYNLWRRVDNLSSTGEIIGAFSGRAGVVGTAATGLRTVEWGGKVYAQGSEPLTISAGTLPNGTWELIGGYAAAQLPEYIAVSPTTADSGAVGIHWSVFVVSAHTPTPSIWFASNPDSGYSVDNIAPAAPQIFQITNVTSQLDVELEWSASEANDFQYFNLYRDTSPGFVPSEANRIAQLTETTYTDPQALQQAAPLYYKLTAVDHAGNEGDESDANTGVVAVGGQALPRQIALYPVAPNPIGGNGVIRFDLPKAVAVELRLYDARGRLVRTAHAGEQLPAGTHQWTWDSRDDAGRQVLPGIYFYRFTAGSFSQTRKAVVMD
jgi:hypothetical protein